MIKTRTTFTPGEIFDVGIARIALANYAFAVKNKGKFVVRFDDCERNLISTKELVNLIKWMEIDDIGPICSSKNKSKYEKALATLLKKGYAYPDMHCETNRGLNRNLPPEMAYNLYEDTGDNVRLKIEANEEIILDDLYQGQVCWNTTSLRDPVIYCNDLPTPFFSEIIDDLEENITHIIRTENYLNITPAQLTIAMALNKMPPFYAHVPILDEHDLITTKEIELKLFDLKLKELNPRTISFYKELGYHPKSIMKYLCGENFKIQNLNNEFKFSDVLKCAAEFTYNTDIDIKTRNCMKFLKQADLINPAPSNNEMFEKVKKVIILCGDRIKVFSDVVKVAGHFFSKPYYNLCDLDRYLNIGISNTLISFNKILKKLFPWNASNIRNQVKDYMEVRKTKADPLIYALRVAIAGKLIGPCIFETMEMIGRDECWARIKNVANRNSSYPTNWGCE